jgi:hypothetical protein
VQRNNVDKEQRLVVSDLDVEAYARELVTLFDRATALSISPP